MRQCLFFDQNNLPRFCLSGGLDGLSRTNQTVVHSTVALRHTTLMYSLAPQQPPLPSEAKTWLDLFIHVVLAEEVLPRRRPWHRRTFAGRLTWREYRCSIEHLQPLISGV